MKSVVNVPCFVCNACESTLVHETQYPIFHYPGVFSLRRCDGCGLLFNSPRLNDEALHGLYDANYYFFQRLDSVEMERITRLYFRTVALLAADIPEKRVAEIGSAKGYLLALLKHLGWQVQGIEISAEAAAHGREKFGVPTYTGTVEDFAASPKRDTFPMVLAIDVIEHVPDPRGFLQAIDQILGNGGILVLDTPNGDARNIETLGTKWDGFNPFHIYLFTGDILKSLLEEMGYAIEMTFTYGNSPKQLTDRAIKARLKDLVAPPLLKLGLFAPCQAMYRGMRNMFRGSDPDSTALIAQAEARIRESSDFRASEDARAPLAEGLRGNNIVVVARKGA